MIECVRYFAGLFNWGDDINPELYRLITGKEPCKMSVLDESPIDHVLMCGSIMNYANEYSHVWGAGFMHSKSPIDGVPEKVHAVRGPLTAKRLEQLGIEVKVPYGDPSMLITNYIERERLDFLANHQERFDIGVIPHYIDKMTVRNWPDEFLKIDISMQNTTDLMLMVNRCEKIISSSLHGLILGDILGKPTLWVKLSNNLAGDDMKFHDYFASIGRKDVEFFDMRGGYVDAVKTSFKDYKVKINLDALMEACPLIN